MNFTLPRRGRNKGQARKGGSAIFTALCLEKFYRREKFLGKLWKPLPDNTHQEVLIDEIVRLTGNGTSGQYPRSIRRIAVYNAEHHFTMVLLTNNMKLSAGTIADLYKASWDIEIFFRNLKQNFHIKSFVGTSSNAVEIQIWTALITILLFAVLKRQATYKWHFSNLVASLRLNTFTKIDLYVWINEPFTPPPETENDT